jgi:hypothetical protein
MAISFETMTSAKASDLPPRILIYGPEKMGKTSLACEFPDPIFLRIECGPPEGIELPGWDIASKDDLYEAIGTLYNEDHDFKTVVIDSVSALERKVIWPHVCDAYPADGGRRAEHIEDFGFGKGYKYALKVWEDVIEGLNSLRSRGMTVILIGHSIVTEFKDPMNTAYSVYDIALQNADKVSAAARLKQEVDAILFINTDNRAEKEDPTNKLNKRVIAKGGSARWIHTEKAAAYSAGNRFGMEPKFPYDKGRGFPVIAEYISALRKYLPAETKKAA